MTGPDAALISIRLLLERPKFLAAQSTSPAYFRGLGLMKMFQEAEIKAPGSTNSSWGIHKQKKSVSARMHTHTHTGKHTHTMAPHQLLLSGKQEQKVTSGAKGSDTESNPFRPELTG